jgi:predicted NBD/HSP70 family sugar kinase
MMADEQVVLVVDVGGSHVKVLASDRREARRVLSGPTLTPTEMVAGARKAAGGWGYEAVSVGVPAPVHGGRVVSEPVNLGKGWVGFDFQIAFGKPTRVINDAAMQALGSYEGGKMLFLGLGTGLGSALIVDGIIEPMELAHLPFKKHTFEDYVGDQARRRLGKKRWQKNVLEAVEQLTAALEPDYIVLGGGNAKRLAQLPPESRFGSNDNAFTGGFRLWHGLADRRSQGTGAATPGSSSVSGPST